MGENSILDEIKTWIRHPVRSAGALIAFRYCERNGLEIHFAKGDSAGD